MSYPFYRSHKYLHSGLTDGISSILEGTSIFLQIYFAYEARSFFMTYSVVFVEAVAVFVEALAVFEEALAVFEEDLTVFSPNILAECY